MTNNHFLVLLAEKTNVIDINLRIKAEDFHHKWETCLGFCDCFSQHVNYMLSIRKQPQMALHNIYLKQS